MMPSRRSSTVQRQPERAPVIDRRLLERAVLIDRKPPEPAPQPQPEREPFKFHLRIYEDCTPPIYCIMLHPGDGTIRLFVDNAMCPVFCESAEFLTDFGDAMGWVQVEPPADESLTIAPPTQP